MIKKKSATELCKALEKISRILKNQSLELVRFELLDKERNLREEGKGE